MSAFRRGGMDVAEEGEVVSVFFFCVTYATTDTDISVVLGGSLDYPILLIIRRHNIFRYHRCRCRSIRGRIVLARSSARITLVVIVWEIRTEPIKE